MPQTVEMPIALGTKVRDRVTGLNGVATCFATYMNGCSRYSIQPPVDKDGKWVDSYWVDVQDVVALEIDLPPADPVQRGGPQRNPVEAATPPP